MGTTTPQIEIPSIESEKNSPAYQVRICATATFAAQRGGGLLILAGEIVFGIPRTGPLSVSVPGIVAGLGAMHRKFGRLTWRDVFAEAITFVRDGFGATRAYGHFAQEYRSTLTADPRSAATFLADGKPPSLGAAIVQPDLAGTLVEIASDGPESLYRGRLARRLAAGLEAAGSLVSAADLETFDADQQEPVGIDYRGFPVLEAPPNSTGFVLLEELKILEHFDLAGMGLLSADAVHVMVEAKKLAFPDRERWGADPRSLEAPLARLLSADHAAQLAGHIDLRRAAPSGAGALAAGDTTYFCTADAEGNAVSGVQSINSGFGSGVMAVNTGILLNNRMSYWHLEHGHPNRLQPGRRVRHTMNPPLVLKDAPWCVFGTPGADNQVQINLQVLSAMIDFGLDPSSPPKCRAGPRMSPANTPTGRMTARMR
jgi:gamma-glutamyltranspeptidase/glutathione hydrolase